MKELLDSNLLNKFNEEINSDNHVHLDFYKNVEGKNKWNIICACMDWLTVAIDYINNYEIDVTHKNINIESMNLYTLISSIDIVYEAINQLHRVIIDSNSIPFNGCSKHFISRPDLENEKDDNSYFKHLRAIFGAHPVNLTGRSWVASWPTIGKIGEVEVLLYSLNDDGTRKIKLVINEVKDFAFERYSYLKILIEELERKKYRIYKELKLLAIQKNEDPLCQIEILLEETTKRRICDYSYELELLKALYEFDCIQNRSLLEKYRIKMLIKIDEIYNNMSNLIYEEIEFFNYKFIPQHIKYDVQKISEARYLYPHNIDRYFSSVARVRIYLEKYVYINEKMKFSEIDILVRIGLNEMNI